MKISTLHVHYQQEIKPLSVRVDLRHAGEYFYKKYTFNCDNPEQRGQWETWVLGMQEALGAINDVQKGFPVVRSPLQYSGPQVSLDTGPLVAVDAHAEPEQTFDPDETTWKNHESLVQFNSYAGTPLGQVGGLSLDQWISKFRNFAGRLAALHQMRVYFVDISPDNMVEFAGQVYQADVDSAIALNEQLTFELLRGLVRARKGCISPLIERSANDVLRQGGASGATELAELMSRQDAWAFIVTVMNVTANKSPRIEAMDAEDIEFIKAQIKSGVPVAIHDELNLQNVFSRNLARSCAPSTDAPFDVGQMLNGFLDDLVNVVAQDQSRMPEAKVVARREARDDLAAALRAVDHTGSSREDAVLALRNHFDTKAMAVRESTLRSLGSRLVMAALFGFILAVLVWRLLNL